MNLYFKEVRVGGGGTFAFTHANWITNILYKNSVWFSIQNCYPMVNFKVTILKKYMNMTMWHKYWQMKLCFLYYHFMKEIPVMGFPLILTPSMPCLSAIIQAISQSVSYVWFTMTTACSLPSSFWSSGEIYSEQSAWTHHCARNENSEMKGEVIRHGWSQIRNYWS